MRKYLATVIIALLLGLGLSWGLPAAAATVSGSSADPLVSQSWVDDYVTRQFDGIRTQLAAIRQRLAGEGTEIVLYINSSEYLVNGERRTMDTAAVINSDWRTMVPVRFVAEALGCSVDYTTDAAGSTTAVYIRK